MKLRSLAKSDARAVDLKQLSTRTQTRLEQTGNITYLLVNLNFIFGRNSRRLLQQRMSRCVGRGYLMYWWYSSAQLANSLRSCHSGHRRWSKADRRFSHICCKGTSFHVSLLRHAIHIVAQDEIVISWLTKCFSPVPLKSHRHLPKILRDKWLLKGARIEG